MLIKDIPQREGKRRHATMLYSLPGQGFLYLIGEFCENIFERSGVIAQGFPLILERNVDQGHIKYVHGAFGALSPRRIIRHGARDKFGSPAIHFLILGINPHRNDNIADTKIYMKFFVFFSSHFSRYFSARSVMHLLTLRINLASLALAASRSPSLASSIFAVIRLL